jgi:hypothetical protein
MAFIAGLVIGFMIGLFGRDIKKIIFIKKEKED